MLRDKDARRQINVDVVVVSHLSTRWQRGAVISRLTVLEREVSNPVATNLQQPITRLKNSLISLLRKKKKKIVEI